MNLGLGPLLRGTWSLAALDLALWRRSPAAIAAALVPPAAMALLLYVLTLAVGQQPVALVMEAHGRHALHMEGIFKNEADTYLLTETDRQTAMRMLASQQVAAVVIVPRGFDDLIPPAPPATNLPTTDMMAGRQRATLQLVLNNVDIDLADDVRRTVAKSIAEFDAPDVVTPASEGQLDMSEPNPYRVNVTTTELRTTTVDYLHYSVIPVLILFVLSVGVMGTALLCAQDVERGTSRYLALSPLPAPALVAGRILGGLLASALVMIPVLAVATLSGIVAPPAGHWPAVIAVFGATALAAAGLGAALGATVRGARLVAMAASVLCTYLFFLGGGFTTVQFLPDWLRSVTALVPVKYAIHGLRQALFYPDLTGVATDLGVLLATAAVAIAAGAYFVRRSWSR
jgi:ABC-2 type transport system permease protein